MNYVRLVAGSFRTLLVVLAAQAVAPAISMAYEEGRTEYGARLRLASLPARVWFSMPVPGFFDGGQGALSRAMATWNGKSCSSPIFSGAKAQTEALVEIRPIRNNWRFGPSIAAHTDIKSDPFKGDIRHVIIEIDASRRWSEDAVVPADALDLETVLLHELGHAVGLDHSRHYQAIMRAGIKPGHAPRRALHEDDIAGICAVARSAVPDVNSLSHVTMENHSRSKWLWGTIVVFVGGLLYWFGSGIHSRKRLIP